MIRRATWVRGGTSKGLMLTTPVTDTFIRHVMGVPDATGLQLNGLGGGISSTSKVAIVSKSTRPGFDLDYAFGQVDITTGHIDWSGTCGNLAAGVYLFALDQNMIPPNGSVRVYCVSPSGLLPEIHLRSAPARVIASVPFENPGVDVGFELGPMSCTYLASLNATLVTGGNPTVFLPDSSSSNLALVRNQVAAQLNLDPSRALALRMSIVGPPRAFTASDKAPHDTDSMDVFAKMSTPGREWHHAFTASGMANLFAALSGSPSLCAHALRRPLQNGLLHIGHPGGVTRVQVVDNSLGNKRMLFIERSAKILMCGTVQGPSL